MECPRCGIKMQTGLATVDTGGTRPASGSGIYFHLGGRNRLPMMRFAETRRAGLCAGCGGLWIEPVE